MTEIRFYHMERSNLEQTLPALVNKALQNGHKIIIKASNENDLEKLNEHLWTYNPNSFLPHGSAKDGHNAAQPVYLTIKDENPNEADVLILTQGAQSESLKDYKLVCEMLDGHNGEQIASARTRWKSYKEDGFEISYWQQGPQGGWENKA